MKHRSRISRKKSRRQFSRTAVKTHSRNRRGGPMRGGYRI